MIVQAQVSLPRDTGLPEDVTVNTFHFDVPGTPVVGDYQALSARLASFYNDTATGETIPVRQALSVMHLHADGATVRYYDAANPDTGGPLHTGNFALDAPGTGFLPEEAAIALSYKADPVMGVPPARLRGRIFLGLLSAECIDVLAGRVVVKGNYLAAITASAKQFLMDNGTAPPWVVWSRGQGTATRAKNPSTTPTATQDWTPFASEITTVWADDAIDTIRSRGTAPGIRATRTKA